MTMKEKIRIHVEIVKSNERKLKEWKEGKTMTYTVEDYINFYEDLSNEELLDELIKYSGSPANKRYRALRILILDKMEGEKK